MELTLLQKANRKVFQMQRENKLMTKALVEEELRKFHLKVKKWPPKIRLLGERVPQTSGK